MQVVFGFIEDQDACQDVAGGAPARMASFAQLRGIWGTGNYHPVTARILYRLSPTSPPIRQIARDVAHCVQLPDWLYAEPTGDMQLADSRPFSLRKPAARTHRGGSRRSRGPASRRQTSG